MAFNRLVITVCGLSFLAAGCSGGGGGGGSSTPATPLPVPTTTATATSSATPTAAPTPTPTETPTPKPTASPEPSATALPTGPVTAVISASTNVQSYTIVLQQSGSATVTQNGYTGTTTVAAADSAQYFKDLNMYSPIADVATLTTCTKSASYGTRTILTYDTSTSGDVSCPPSPTAPAGYLYDDELQIEKDMKASLGPFNH